MSDETTWGLEAMARARTTLTAEDVRVRQERDNFIYEMRQTAKGKIAQAICFTHPRIPYRDMLRCFLDNDTEEALDRIRNHNDIVHPRGHAHCNFYHIGHQFSMTSEKPLPLVMTFRPGANKEHTAALTHYFDEVRRLSDVRERLLFTINKLVADFGQEGAIAIMPELVAFKNHSGYAEEYPTRFDKGGPSSAAVTWDVKAVMRGVKAEIVGVLMLADSYEEGTSLDWHVECASRWQPPTVPEYHV
jgi:hypothetical protein